MAPNVMVVTSLGSSQRRLPNISAGVQTSGSTSGGVGVAGVVVSMRSMIAAGPWNRTSDVSTDALLNTSIAAFCFGFSPKTVSFPSTTLNCVFATELSSNVATNPLPQYTMSVNFIIIYF